MKYFVIKEACVPGAYEDCDVPQPRFVLDSNYIEDLNKSIGEYFATDRLKERFEQLGFTGCTFEKIETRLEDQWLESHGPAALPILWQIKLSEEPGGDVFRAFRVRMIVSERFKILLEELNCSSIKLTDLILPEHYDGTMRFPDNAARADQFTKKIKPEWERLIAQIRDLSSRIPDDG